MPFSQLMVLPELWPKEVMSERVKFVREMFVAVGLAFVIETLATTEMSRVK